MKKPCMNCGTPITKEYCEDGWPNGCDHWTPQKPKTNADRFRAMSDEELAKLLYGFCENSIACWDCQHFDSGCGGKKYESWVEWLQQPAEGE